jgi:hypothetical protein
VHFSGSDQTGKYSRAEGLLSELLGVWTFPIVRCLGSRNKTFRERDLFPSSGEGGGEDIYSVGPVGKS